MPPPEKEPRVPIKSLRTYQGDVEEAIGKNKYSASTILVAEQKRKEEEKPVVFETKYNPLKNKLYVYLGLSLLVLGVGVVTAVYYIRSNEKVVIEKQTKALIAFSQEKNIPITGLTRDQFIKRIITEKDAFKSPVNSVLYLNFTSLNGEPAPLEIFLKYLAPNMPSSLVRSFKEEYMLGIYSFDTNEPFVILTVDDYALSYAGMLKWEKQMIFDLNLLYPSNLGENHGFVDLAIRNKDIRAYRDENNNTLVLYSFIDKKTLIIARNENLFNAVLSKYMVSGQSR
jgi:hypothetical protein